jgi:RNA polymerase sigma-70 factor (ECF subfamily)
MLCLYGPFPYDPQGVSADDADPRSDVELFAAINRGDEVAFGALYFRHRDWVVGLARRFTGDDADALDVLQETFAYLLRKVPRLKLTARITTFLYPVVRNLSIAARRKRGRGASEAEALELLPARGELHSGEAGELGAVLAGLPGGQREVLLMRFVDDFSLEEIAEALGIPVGTVKSRIHNALKALREDARTKAYFAIE